MKYLLLKVVIQFLKMFYAPMKGLKTKNKIVYLSRQSNKKSLDMILLSREIQKQNPEVKQVFRLRTMEKTISSMIKNVWGIIGDMYHLATAKVAICDTYSITVSCLDHKEDLQVVQMWHALGATKKFGLQSAGMKAGRDKRMSKMMRMHENYDYVFAPSKATGAFYQEAFGVEPEKIVILPLPRVDYVVQAEEKKAGICKENPRLEGKRIVLYLPTFREGEEEIVAQLQDAFRHAVNHALIISLHPLSKAVCEEDFTIQGKYNVFDLMKAADVVITDYSACAFEAAVLQKELFFYVPDYEKYETERGMNIPLKKEMAEYTFETAEDLCNAIVRRDYNFEKIAAFQSKYVENTQDCTQSMAGFIGELLRKGEGQSEETQIHNS